MREGVVLIGATFAPQPFEGVVGEWNRVVRPLGVRFEVLGYGEVYRALASGAQVAVVYRKADVSRGVLEGMSPALLVDAEDPSISRTYPVPSRDMPDDLAK
eukprot:Sspe_Gene.81311::Locus_51996_Transcript_1_1_Confidence_1.000_Length_417::g.81311::m.81311